MTFKACSNYTKGPNYAKSFKEKQKGSSDLSDDILLLCSSSMLRCLSWKDKKAGLSCHNKVRFGLQFSDMLGFVSIAAVCTKSVKYCVHGFVLAGCSAYALTTSHWD